VAGGGGRGSCIVGALDISSDCLWVKLETTGLPKRRLVVKDQYPIMKQHSEKIMKQLVA